MSKRKVLGIIGSPRKNGNTDILIREILQAAEESGLETDSVYLYDCEIHPCTACDSCSKTKKCIHDDDMTGIIDKIGESSILVLGTPVYWWGPSAQMKAFIDRWYGVDRSLFKGKDCLCVIPSGAESKHYSRHVVGMFEDIIPYVGMNLMKTIIASGHGPKGSVRNDTSLMEQAGSLGRGLNH
ncbi:MAG: hypothetical protein GF411_03685 [Candidatus Lokiarchaeota archaeon]|nr:hypothetical protein [Candidatus Lokiarchaeota archaeon]